MHINFHANGAHPFLRLVAEEIALIITLLLQPSGFREKLAESRFPN